MVRVLQGLSGGIMTDMSSALRRFSVPGTRPAIIGYDIGYRIAKSVFDGQSDPGQAIDAMVNIDDYEGFLESSGYGSQFR
jgi:hypothetical protein